MSPESTLEARANRTPWLDPVSGGLPQVPSREALPTATADHYGRLIHVQGTPSAAYICLKTSGGAYYWASMFVADGDKGDIVVSSNGSNWQIDAGAVGTTELADDGTTYAKIQNVSATDRLLGRDTAGAGDIEELTVTAPLAFTGAGGLELQNDGVTYAKIQNVSATDRILGRDTAGAGDIEELTVTAPLAFTGSGGLTVTDVVRVLDRDNNGTSGTGPSNTTTETTIYTYSLTGGVLAVDHSLRLTLACAAACVGAISSFTIRVKFGGGTLFSRILGPGVMGETYHVSVDMLVTNAGATNVQIIAWNALAPDLETQQVDTHKDTAAVDTTSTQTLEITAQLSDATAGNNFKVYSAVLELI